MTKEDAIDIIKSECYVFNPLNFDKSIMVNTALDMAIKALKQEDILDEILSEIFNKQYDHMGCGTTGEDISFGLTLAAAIICKYKDRK